MNANLKKDLQTLKQAHKKIAVTTELERNKVLEALQYKLIERKAEIFSANRRDIENRKVKCGKAHFDALGVNFKVATNIHEVLAK